MMNKINYADRPQNQVKYYTPEALEYVIKNIQSMSYKEMAEHIGCTEYGLKNQISQWRKIHNIPRKPYREKVAVGTISNRGKGVFKKTEEGWKRVSKPKDVEKAPKPAITKTIKRKKATNVRTDGNRKSLAKKPVKVFEKRKEDLSNKVLVKIDNRTWVYRDKSKIA